ncbi:hypothetical protein C8Q76DRAFT_698839 [Earliella scabrosa]|nr:hypothetical protein C8Q76DRAFT_698839 [Earliella scabrosa]
MTLDELQTWKAGSRLCVVPNILSKRQAYSESYMSSSLMAQVPKTKTKKTNAPAGKVRKAKAKGPETEDVDSEPENTTALDTFGWVSEVPENQTITYLRAGMKYRVTTKQLQGINFTQRDHSSMTDRRRRTRSQFDQLLERQVERKAWEIYGGPDKFWIYLKERLQVHLDGGMSSESFHIPYDYEPGRLYDLRADSPPTIPDRYVQQSATIQQAKERLPPWLWKVCNTELPMACPLLPCHLNANKPSAPERTSDQWGMEITNLRWLPDKQRYDWSVEFTERVLKALCALVKADGLDEKGWKTARWKVYRQYVKTVAGGIHYDPSTQRWHDPAGE